MNVESDKPQAAPLVNISRHLARMAQQYPERPAVVSAAGRGRYSHLTFQELDRRTDGYARGLQRIGVGRGTRTILMVRPGFELFALTFALFRIGAVPVLIDPGLDRKDLVRALAGVEAEAFIGIPLAHVLRILHPGAFSSLEIIVTVGARFFWGGYRLADLQDDASDPLEPTTTRADEPAAILFTSGSTGPPKGVVYTHGIFDAQMRYLKSQYGCGPEETDLATFPLFALFDAALGMTAVIPDMDAAQPGAANPVKIIEALRSQKCTRMFASPALLDRVARYGEARGVTLPSLERVITAGAPVHSAMLERFHRLLSEDAQVFTPYGATEALPITSIDSREILAETGGVTAAGGGTCVGRPLEGVTVRIIEISDEPIDRWGNARGEPPGTIGEIVVKGPIVTREYFRRPEETVLAKIPDGDDVWHRMGDVGYVDRQGRLWFCGRKAHRVVTERGTLFTIPCEAIFNRHPGVRRSALVGVGEAGRQRPVICIELEAQDNGADREQLTGELLALGQASELTREIETVLYHPGFPVDVRHNAKIFREKLALWAAEQLG